MTARTRPARGTVLHVLNGDTTADVLARSGVPGERLPFREALVSGPAPCDLGPEEWRAARAAHLAAEAGLDEAGVAGELERGERELEGLGEFAEVVLWFEPDLFCQVNLIHLLDRMGRRGPVPRRLSLVYPGEVEGVEDFRRLGRLSPEDLAALHEERRPVTEAEIALATEAWAAYRSPDPTAIEDLLAGDTTELPFLHEAMLLHLARFPSSRNGLGQVENLALGRVLASVTAFRDLFREFSEAEPGYGFGDLQFFAALERLTGGREPLLVRDGGAPRGGAVPAGVRYGITETGLRVARSEADQVHVNGIDLWLGGAHLREGELWRWDERAEELVPEGSAADA